MPYQLRAFGGLDLREPDGSPAEPMLAHSKGMALLAVLAVEAREEPVSRSRVAALLWPDRPEERSQNALRITLTRIRKDADPGLVAGKRESTLRLDPELVDVDLWAFDDARAEDDPRRALEHYRGHFLEGFRVDDAPPFERWADEMRERCRDRAYEAALAGGADARRRGDLSEAAERYREAHRLRPLREDAVAGLIQVLAERGREAEALRTFQDFRDRRWDQLDLEPSEELQGWVDRIRAGELAPASSGEVDESDGAAGSPPTDREPMDGGAERSRRLRSVLAIAASLLAVAAGSVGAWHLLGIGGTDSPAAEAPSVAVLPFGAIGEEEPGSLARGLHSDLLTRLSSVSGLDVVSGTSVHRFRGERLPLPAIAESLGVDWIVEGAVQRTDDQVGVNVQLIDPRTDHHAWAETYLRDYTAEGLIELQGDIARRVSEVLETRLAAGEATRLYRQSTGSLDAYRYHIRGRSLVEERTVEAMRRGLDYFEQALEQDSTYAPAWAGVADALSLLAHHGGVPADSAMPLAGEAARRALERDPDLAEAHLARGRLYMFEHDGPGALRHFERAVELRPGYAAAHAWLAKLLLTLGRPERSLEHVERAVELDPLSWENQATLSLAALANGRYERALRAGRRTTELKSQLGREVLPSMYEVLALVHLDRTRELKQIAREDDRPVTARPFEAIELAAGGDTALLERLRGGEGPVMRIPFTRALLHAALGAHDSAFSVIREHFPREEGLWEIGGPIFLRYYWPTILSPLRQDPRWDDFIADVNRFWGLEPDGRLPEEEGELVVVG